VNSFALPRFPHQEADTAQLVDGGEPVLLGLKMGLGKSRIAIDTAHIFFERRDIDAMLVVVPAEARSVWADPDPVLGEYSKWCWPSIESEVTEYRRGVALPKANGRTLHVVVSNPEMVRREEHCERLRAWCKTRKVYLVIDESWMIQSPTATQSKSLLRIRTACRHCTLLNGTPGEWKQLYAQFRVLKPDIFGTDNWFHWKARYCRMGGWNGKEIQGYNHVEELTARTAKNIIIRDTRDHLDLGLPPVRTQIEAAFTPKNWKLYKQMRDDLIAWLDSTKAATASQAGVKALRLAQMCNGFVGGVIEEDPDLLDDGAEVDTLVTSSEVNYAPPVEIGQEKLDALIAWLKDHWSDPKLVIFTRFRADVERTVRVLADTYRTHKVAPIYGQQKPDERREIKRLLAPGGDAGPAIGVVNPQSGGAGLNLAAAQIAVFAAWAGSLRVRQQAEGRLDRPGQTGRVTYLDILAVGPNGERTVDHGLAAGLRRDEEMANWTKDQWRELLEAA
jgi:hypothetical protein